MGGVAYRPRSVERASVAFLFHDNQDAGCARTFPAIVAWASSAASIAGSRGTTARTLLLSAKYRPRARSVIPLRFVVDMPGSRRREPREAVPPPLHELESEVMEDVWRAGESTVREVMERLNPRTSKPRAYTTYMTVMARLHKKGVLDRRRDGKTDFYAPTLSREQFMAARAKSEVAELVAQYGDVALSHFARQFASLDPARRRALQRLARKV